jgi:hypothetical protein
MTAYYEYLFKKYPILENASTVNLTPDIIIEYQLFGDPSGKWNDTFEETIKLFPM